MRQIEVTPAVFHLIWSNWMAGDSDENSILERLLTPSKSQSSNGLGRKEEKYYAKNNCNTQPNTGAVLGKVRWVDDVRRAFEISGGEADLDQIYRKVTEIRRAAGRSVVRSLEATVRQTIEAHSSDSLNFKPGNNDYFRHVGRGRWALR